MSPVPAVWGPWGMHRVLQRARGKLKTDILFWSCGPQPKRKGFHVIEKMALLVEHFTESLWGAQQGIAGDQICLTQTFSGWASWRNQRAKTGQKSLNDPSLLLACWRNTGVNQEELAINLGQDSTAFHHWASYVRGSNLRGGVSLVKASKSHGWLVRCLPACDKVEQHCGVFREEQNRWPRCGWEVSERKGPSGACSCLRASSLYPPTYTQTF